MNVITHGLTASMEFEYSEFNWFWYPGMGPKPFSALPLESLPDASPKAISERTSYLQVRLEFLRYPHLIPALFNVRGFGPPVGVTLPSPWTWVDHLVSGLRQRTERPVQTRFRYGSASSA